MKASEKFKKYCEIVCAQIRWKKAHGVVAKEIENHLTDQKNAYLSQGIAEEIAEEKAILQMGDPVEIGMELDSTHKPAPQWGMLGLVLLLLGIGAFLQLQFALPLTDSENAAHLYPAHLCAMLLGGAVTLVLFYHLDFSFFGKHPFLPLLLLLACLILKELRGDMNWLRIGGFAIHSTLLAALFPPGCCGLLYFFRRADGSGYLKACTAAGVVAICLGAFCGLAGFYLFAAAIAPLFYIASKRWFNKWAFPIFLLFAAAGIAFTLVLLFGTHYPLIRIAGVLHPENAPLDAGYIPLLLRGLLAESNLIGAADSYRANPQLLQEILLFGDNTIHNTILSDYFLTFVTYRFGWLVSGGVVALLAVFLIWGYRKCLRQKSILGQMASLCILSIFTAECFWYLLANLGYPFLSSASMPFLSTDIGAIIVHTALAGILLSVFRTGEVYRDRKLPLAPSDKFIQWEDGRLIISFR